MKKKITSIQDNQLQVALQKSVDHFGTEGDASVFSKTLGCWNSGLTTQHQTL
jgi:hypothetical protein